MPRCSRLTLWLALLALMMPGLAPASAQAPRNKAGKKASRQPAEPVRPPLPQELPPVAPTVTFRGGQLSIVAPNSTLLDILMAVRKATGAAVDAPPGAASDRVATRLGPGRPREVLTALLEGSKFDYILLGSAQDPAGIRRLILSPRSGGSGPAAAGNSASPTSTMFSRPARPPLSTGSTEEEDSQPEQTVEPAEEVAPEPQTEPQSAPQPEGKTPEQIQEELRKQLEEQQRQQQQQQEQQQQEQPQ